MPTLPTLRIQPVRVLVALSLLAAAPVARAQAPGPPGAPPAVAPGGGPGPREHIRTQVRARVRALIAEKLTRMLNFDAPTAQRVFAIADRFDGHDAGAATYFMHPYIVREQNGALDLVYYAGNSEGDAMGSFRRSRSSSCSLRRAH